MLRELNGTGQVTEQPTEMRGARQRRDTVMRVKQSLHRDFRFGIAAELGQGVGFAAERQQGVAAAVTGTPRGGQCLVKAMRYQQAPGIERSGAWRIQDQQARYESFGTRQHLGARRDTHLCQQRGGELLHGLHFFSMRDQPVFKARDVARERHALIGHGQWRDH